MSDTFDINGDFTVEEGIKQIDTVYVSGIYRYLETGENKN